MKITIANEKKEEELKFPCLMINDEGLIVLFTWERIGTSLNKIDERCLGYQSNCFQMKDFKPFNGTITLSNN